MTENNIDLIADYLNEKLDFSQRADFEKELLSNDSLQKETEKMRLLKKVVERERILEEAKRIHNQAISDFKTPITKVIPWAKIASFAAAASVIFILYLGNVDVNYIEISTAERGENTTTSALTNFEKGIFFLKENNPSKAITEFNYIIDNQDVEEYYQDASKWYKVVALTELNKDVEAKALLNSIENDTDFKYKVSFLDTLKIKFRLFF